MKIGVVSALFTLLLSAPTLAESPKGVVTGHIVGLSVGDKSAVHVSLIRYHVPCVLVQSPVREDGSFQFQSLAAGDYSVAVTGLPGGYGLKSMTAGGIQLLSESLKVTASSSSAVPPIQIEVAHLSEFRQNVIIVGNTLGTGCIVHRVTPVYPPEAKKARIEGDVILSATIDANGSVVDVNIIDGNPRLVQSASDAVRQWRYAPFVFRGELTATKTTIIVPFKLQ